MQPEQQRRLALYKELLLRWTERINLIGPEARRNVDDHIAEAVAAADLLRPAGEVLDFGSGGGLPAIPMAIVAPGARFHLVEVDVKKVAFLKRAARDCSLNSIVHGDRLDRVLTQLDPRLRFSLITSRAVGNPAGWVPLLEPWLADEAVVALFEGSDEVPQIEGFVQKSAMKLPRGQHNYLVLLTRST